MWRPLSRPPGEVAASGLGASPGIAPGLASQKATARSPGRQPFWPTQSHLLHPMALQWPERAERALSTPNPKKSSLRQVVACLAHQYHCQGQQGTDHHSVLLWQVLAGDVAEWHSRWQQSHLALLLLRRTRNTSEMWRVVVGLLAGLGLVA